MYASIRKYKLKPNSTTEITKSIDETFVPMLKKAPGFVAYYAIQTSGDTLASISIFETKTGAEESNRLAAGFVKEYVTPFVVGSPEIISGEVLAATKK